VAAHSSNGQQEINVITRNTGNPAQFLQDGEKFPYQFDVQKAIKWLGDRWLLAKPVAPAPRQKP
jgi:hypothetical protein